MNCIPNNFPVLVRAITVIMLVCCWANESVSVRVRCIEKERQALLRFKHALIDDEGRLSSWAVSHDCCTWNGVLCNPHSGHVLHLHLPANESSIQPLRGEISPSLMELQYLNYLNLSFNNFTKSQIPEFLGSLTKLRYLDLSYASFGGTIPYQLGKLSSLQVLDLSRNSLVGMIPCQLGNLSNLQELRLNSNNLVGTIPYQLGNLSSLQILWIGFNNDNLKINEASLAGIDWLSNLASLVNLDLTGISNLNYFNNFLQVIGQLSNLIYLWLYSCNLIDIDILSIPLSHLNFSASLVSLDLRDNNLTSSIFPWLFNFSANLASLYLNHNQLAGPIPDDFGKIMSNLEDLELSDNQLDGIVSDIHFHNLTKLQSLDLSNNLLAMKFSNSWVPPFQLQWLYLRHCKLGPGFPTWLRTQHNLQALIISDAEIYDVVPEWFWELTRGMEFVHFRFSNLIGTIPNLSLEFTKTQVIDLASNQFKGSIPSFLLNVLVLDISGNQFSELFLSCGKDISANVENLGLLNISSNKLSGQLLDCWSHFKSLTLLDLSNNQLSGKVSTSLGSLLQIQQLILHANLFRGELPNLKNYNKLELLDMGKNELSGKIPSWIGENLKGLEILILTRNKLNGNLPLHMCYLTSARILDLSFNSFTGPIPSCFYNLTGMAQTHEFNDIMNIIKFHKNGRTMGSSSFYMSLPVVWKGRELQYRDRYRSLYLIDLSHNQLTGEIPTGIGHLIELVSLNLSSNSLSENIIPEIGQLKSLEVLDLSKNNFSGKIPTSLAEISSLKIMDLSNNNLSGKIPIGTQLQTFDASCYEGNPYLCGTPLSKLCSSEDSSRQGGQVDHEVDEDNEVSNFIKGFYESIGVGFATGFWIVFGSLLLIRSWRHAYFAFLNKLADYIYVTKTLFVRRWRRRLKK